MGILKVFEDCIGKINPELIKDRTIYIELDSQTNKEFKETELANLDCSTVESKIPDVGNASVVNFMGYKFIIVENKDVKTKMDDFYIAFKTKIV